MSTSLSAVIDEPQVLTGHTDVICSTSIERIITMRNTALVQIDAFIHQLEDISAITNSIGGGIARDWAMRQDFRCGCWPGFGLNVGKRRRLGTAFFAMTCRSGGMRDGAAQRRATTSPKASMRSKCKCSPVWQAE